MNFILYKFKEKYIKRKQEWILLYTNLNIKNKQDKTCITLRDNQTSSEYGILLYNKNGPGHLEK